MLEEVINKIAEEENLDPSLVRRIISSQFLFMKDAMKDKKSFRLPWIGSFEFNQKKADKVEKMSLSKKK